MRTLRILLIILTITSVFTLKASGPESASNPKVENPKTSTIDLSNLENIRRKADAIFLNAPYLFPTGQHKIKDEDGSTGVWCKSPRDPALLLPFFSHVKLKNGYRLVAYQWLDDIGGYAHVYGLPENRPWPEASECLKSKKIPASKYEPEHEYLFPLPPGAMEDLSSLLQLDGSPESFSEAALFLQEVSDMGAFWHGVSWGSFHFVRSIEALTQFAARSRNNLPKGDSKSNPLKEWHWVESSNCDLRPSVCITSGKVKVTWFTFCDRGLERLERWTFDFDSNDFHLLETQVTLMSEGTMATTY